MIGINLPVLQNRIKQKNDMTSNPISYNNAKFQDISFQGLTRDMSKRAYSSVGAIADKMSNTNLQSIKY